jgi:hypothetical protein
MTTGFQRLILLAFANGANTVEAIVATTHAYAEDVECALNELEKNKSIQVVHRTLGVYRLSPKTP